MLPVFLCSVINKKNQFIFLITEISEFTAGPALSITINHDHETIPEQQAHISSHCCFNATCVFRQGRLDFGLLERKGER